VSALRRPANGALAGAVAAAAWLAQQPLDKRVFRCGYSDAELLGKAVTRRPAWLPIGIAMHVANGAAFGAAFAVLRPRVPGPPAAAGLAAAMAENFGSWPLIGLAERHHPARRELPRLAGSSRALAQSTWRHALFGVLMGALEGRLNRAPAAAGP
jgi:hypothetical protein